MIEDSPRQLVLNTVALILCCLVVFIFWSHYLGMLCMAISLALMLADPQLQPSVTNARR